VRVKRGLVSIAVLLAVALVSLRARADEESIDDLKNRGNRAMMDMNYAEALDAYRAAYARTPDDASLLYNIGRAHQAREDYPAALDALEEFDKKASVDLRSRVPRLAELIADVRARVADVRVTCPFDVPDGQVTIGEKTRVQGCGPTVRTARVSLPAKTGSFEVKLVSETYQAPPVRVDLVGGKSETVVLRVFQKALSGIVLVTADPSSATIAVDGVARGNSPVEALLPAGAHVIDVQAERYKSARLPIVVEGGQTRRVDVTLERSGPITSRWWFWVGVGAVVVAGATVVTILVVQPERDPTQGSILPGVVTTSFVTF
jgi:hypothetical protein